MPWAKHKWRVVGVFARQQCNSPARSTGGIFLVVTDLPRGATSASSKLTFLSRYCPRGPQSGCYGHAIAHVACMKRVWANPRHYSWLMTHKDKLRGDLPKSCPRTALPTYFGLPTFRLGHAQLSLPNAWAYSSCGKLN